MNWFQKNLFLQVSIIYTVGEIRIRLRVTFKITNEIFINSYLFKPVAAYYLQSSNVNAVTVNYVS